MAEHGPQPGENPGADDVARTDRFVDALAHGRPAECADPGDRLLAALLADWRDELRQPAADTLCTEEAAAVALRDVTGPPRRRHPGLGLIGLAAATLLALGGVGAVIAGSEPGDALYGLRSTLFGEPASVADNRIALTAKTEFGKVRQLIAQGDWDQAEQRLTGLDQTVQTVSNAQRRQELTDELSLLTFRVQHRDPNAAPPGAIPNAGGPEKIPPSATPGQCLAACN